MGTIKNGTSATLAPQPPAQLKNLPPDQGIAHMRYVFDQLRVKPPGRGVGPSGDPVVSSESETLIGGADLSITVSGGPGPNTTVSDGGGRKMTSAKLYVIFWGDGWQSVTPGSPSMGDVLNDISSIVNSPYLNGLREYTPFTRATLEAAYFVDGYNPPGSFTSADTDYIAWYMMAYGPIPETLETIVCVMMPPDRTHSKLGQHSFSIAPNTTTVPVLWVLYRSRNGISCTFSHELVECITDPDGTGIQVNPRGITDFNEIGDACNDFCGLLNGVMVQSYWSQNVKACIIPVSMGIGGYDLASAADRAFAFDFAGSGKLDHLVLYRPGTGTIWILHNNQDGTFTPVYNAGDPGNGIGGYDLASPADQVFPFDFDSSGKLDHLVLYRPGTGTIWILHNNQDGTFSPVYNEGDPGNGIGGYDLASPTDQVFPFDFDSSGKLDHLVLYRPGTGTIWILHNNQDGTFTPVYNEGDPGNGIGGYDLASPADRAFAFDFDGSGKLDHLALYRPGTGTIWILHNNQDGTFTPVYKEGDPGNGIGGYDLASPADRAIAFDFDSSGKLDYFVLYRPGKGYIRILLNNHDGTFAQVPVL
ncbi:FG-GAP-like repeat-containing protein [Burkholderia stagnalis]